MKTIAIAVCLFFLILPTQGMGQNQNAQNFSLQEQALINARVLNAIDDSRELLRRAAGEKFGKIKSSKPNPYAEWVQVLEEIELIIPVWNDLRVQFPHDSQEHLAQMQGAVMFIRDYAGDPNLYLNMQFGLQDFFKPITRFVKENSFKGSLFEPILAAILVHEGWHKHWLKYPRRETYQPESWHHAEEKRVLQQLEADGYLKPFSATAVKQWYGQIDRTIAYWKAREAAAAKPPFAAAPQP